MTKAKERKRLESIKKREQELLDFENQLIETKGAIPLPPPPPQPKPKGRPKKEATELKTKKK